MKCPNCGAETNGSFCGYCGSEVKNDAATVNIINNYYSDAKNPNIGNEKKGCCPKCSSSNISYTREQVSTYLHSNGIARTSQTAYKTVGLCQNCGYTWSPDALNKQANSNTSSATSQMNGATKTAQSTVLERKTVPKKNDNTWLWVLGWIFIFPVPLMIILLKDKKIGSFLKTILIILAWIFYLSFCCCSQILSDTDEEENISTQVNSSEESLKLDSSIWATKATEISNFDYYIDGSEIYLKRYDGSEKKIKIPNEYEIDGVKYTVAGMDGTFSSRKISSCILPEGLKTVSDNLFNSSSVKYVYLPSTIEIGDRFVGYFHDAEKIYYGGSEAMWNSMVHEERSRIDVKQIVFDANDELLFSSIPASKIELFKEYVSDNEVNPINESANYSVIPTSENVVFAKLSDFWVAIDDANKTITLRQFETHDKTCYISPIYNIDGQEYKVVSLGEDACFFGRTSLETCAIPDGVSNIANNTFNSSSVKNLILPSTITDLSGVYDYMHDLKVVYYAGSEEQWNAVRGASDFNGNVEVVCNVAMPSVADNKSYARNTLTIEKSQAEQLGGSMGNALNGFFQGLSEGLAE